MDDHPELFEGKTFEVARRNGPPTAWGAREAVGATVDVCRAMGFPVAPQIKARIGKGAKELLGAGFDPKVVTSAMVVAVRTGWFGSVETIAQEMVVALAGGRMARAEYQQALAETSTQISHGQSEVWQTMREEMARRAEPKEEA